MGERRLSRGGRALALLALCGPAAAALAVGAQPSAAGTPARLVASTASPFVIQRQPPPGACHARGRGPDSLPDPRCTPGAVNPAVTPTTIDRTICVPGWTRRVRPSERVTEPEKRASLVAYGAQGPVSAYEYDHLVPLELGGAVNDPRNLWPEPGASPNLKDAVENRLREAVCDGRLALRTAQAAIARDWVALR